MKTFDAYARYYNLLYKDKDYRGEADYIEQLVRKNHPITKTILNLGCGTGKHDFELIKKSYEVFGVDLSANMISEANKFLSIHFPDAKASFVKGDVRSVRLNREFDTVISLFHVISYQTSNEDVLKMLFTASVHLKKGGIFIFDCWYGPAVLTDRPEVRIKRLENEEITITRIAEPVMHTNENVVDVNYEVNIAEKAKTQKKETIKETHPMRYFFIPELKLFLQQSGFQMILCEEWMTGKEPGMTTWNVVFVCKK